MPTSLTDYYDIQVNGYGGIDYNTDDLTLADLRQSCDKLKADGNTGILGTIITEACDKMAVRLRNLARYREQDPQIKKMIQGIHIEGPFINPEPGYRGAHPPDAIHPANLDEMKQLLDAAGGLTRIVTLAPENDPELKVTRYLADQGIIVSAGHCNPTLDQLDAAIDAGLSMFTHLGNGCPMNVHRHDNIVQRALSRADKLTLCFIADGVHVPWAALGNYLKIANPYNTIITTDAMSAAGLGPGRYQIGRWDLLIGEDLAAWAPDRSHLVGSAIHMNRVVENLKTQLGLRDEQIQRMTVDNPRRVVSGES